MDLWISHRKCRSGEVRDIPFSQGFLWFVGDKKRSLKNYQYSTEGQKVDENLAPVQVIISGHSLVFSKKIITSTGFHQHCAPDASAPAVVINESPKTSLFLFGVFSCVPPPPRKKKGRKEGQGSPKNHMS